MSPQAFRPTDHDWQTRLEAIDPRQYAATRNSLSGAVSYLSPYFTHGFLSLHEAVQSIRSRTRLSPEDKLFAEFGWRAFFHHVWSHQGEAIFQDLRPALPGVRYASELTPDIREGRTGLPVIDQAVATLYSTGYLHNHARMWLASYIIHLRHIHWTAGADWLYGHLLDGDLASNHLSWQWVASTFSTKPYLFNADNVAKYAPRVWNCKGTPLDTSYESLDDMARGQDEEGRSAFEKLAENPARQAFALEEPTLQKTPPESLLLRLNCHQQQLPNEAVRDADVIELVHAWALRSQSFVQLQTGQKLCRIGVIHLPAHAQRPWSERRWAFVLERMSKLCDATFVGDVRDLSSALPREVARYVSRDPGSPETLTALGRLDPLWLSAPPMLREPTHFCGSFSKYFRAAAEHRSGPRSDSFHS